MATPSGRCTGTEPGCPCQGDEAVHERRSRELREARAHPGEAVPCPECGETTTALRLLTWGNCRACRTAQSRSVRPLRW